VTQTGSGTPMIEAFDEAMLDVYREAKAIGYVPVRFLQMVQERGGLETARYLLHEKNVSEGFTALWTRGRLDLTVEAVVLKDRWSSLFTPEELKIARERLQALGYDPTSSASFA
jgi:hypothetical protein